MNGLIGRIPAAFLAAELLSIALIAGCSVPSVTNVTPERVMTGEASASAGTQFPTDGEPVAIAITEAGNYLYTANLLNGIISAFSVQSTGGIAAIKGSPFQT